jgi:hypothetical protein
LTEVPKDRRVRLGDLKRWTEALRQGPDSRKALTETLDPERLKPMIGRMAKGDVADIDRGRAWLASGGPDMPQRRLLWDAFREGVRRRADGGMEASGPSGASRPSLPEPPAWGEREARQAAEATRARDIERARAAVLRLRLTSGADLSGADGLVAAVKARPQDAAAWQKLAALLKSGG